MREVFFHRDLDGTDTSYFIDSLGVHRQAILDDLIIVAAEGPDFLGSCRHTGDGIWEYRREMSAGSSIILLFALVAEGDFFIVLHGFRFQGRGSIQSDLKIARRRLKDYS